MAKDKAVASAKETLDGTHCECGHTHADHAPKFEIGHSGMYYGECCEQTCPCKRFRPVVFVVYRDWRKTPKQSWRKSTTRRRSL